MICWIRFRLGRLDVGFWGIGYGMDLWSCMAWSSVALGLLGGTDGLCIILHIDKCQHHIPS